MMLKMRTTMFCCICLSEVSSNLWIQKEIERAQYEDSFWEKIYLSHLWLWGLWQQQSLNSLNLNFPIFPQSSIKYYILNLKKYFYFNVVFGLCLHWVIWFVKALIDVHLYMYITCTGLNKLVCVCQPELRHFFVILGTAPVLFIVLCQLCFFVKVLVLVLTKTLPYNQEDHPPLTFNHQ